MVLLEVVDDNRGNHVVFSPTLPGFPFSPAATCHDGLHFPQNKKNKKEVHRILCCGTPRGRRGTMWARAGISLYQARTGEGLDLSERIGSPAAACARAAAPATLPLINGLGPDN